MPLFSFPDPFAELDLLDAVERRFQRVQAATTFLNPDILSNAASLLSRHPTLPQPFAVASLMMNMGDWPSVQDVATRAAVENDRPNYDYRTAARDHELTRRRLDVNPEKFTTRENPITTFSPLELGWKTIKGTVRGAFTAAESAFDEFAQAPLRQIPNTYRGAQAAGANPLQAGALAVGQAGDAFGSPFGITAGMSSATARGIGSDVPNQQGQSQLALAIQQHLKGERVNLGSGFFPGQDPQPAGMSDQEYQHKYGLPINKLSHELREETQIGSRFGVSTAVSPGRLIFNNVVEPGTREHNLMSGAVDIAWNMAADPTVAVGAPVSAFRKASKSFRAASGLVDDGMRLTVDGVNARSWMNGADGDMVATVLANRNRLSDLRDILPDVNDRHLLNALRTTDDPQKIKEILLPELGVKVNKIPYSGGLAHQALGTPTVGEAASYLPLVDKEMARIVGFSPTVLRQFRSTKLGSWFSRKPGLHISAANLNQAFQDVDSWMQHVGFDPDLREKHLQNWASVQDNNSTQMYTAARALMRDSTKRLMDVFDEKDAIRKGIPYVGPKATGVDASKMKSQTKSVIRGIHRLFDNFEDANLYFMDEVGNPVWFPGVKQKGTEGFVQPTAHTLSEHLNSGITLPDPADVERAMGRLHRYGKVKSVDKNALVGLTETVMTKIWAPMALMSASWPMKVLGEEQTRMWFKGLRSSANDPLQFIAALTFGKVDPANRMKAFTMAGDDLKALAADQDNLSNASAIIDNYRSAMSRTHMGFLGPEENVVGLTKHFKKKYKGTDEDFFEDWADVELGPLANDPIVNRILSTGIEDAKQHFWSGNLRSFREDLANSMADPEDTKRLLEDRHFAETFMDSYNARIHMKTGGTVHVIPGGGYIIEKPGHGDLLNILKTGKYVRKQPKFVDQKITDTIRQHQDTIKDAQHRINIASGEDDVAGIDALKAVIKERNKQIKDLQKEAKKAGNKVSDKPDVKMSVVSGDPNFDPHGLGELLETKYANYAPDVIKGVDRSLIDRSANEGMWKRMTDTWFTLAMSKPTNFLSRSPAFDQFMWSKVDELVPYIRPEDRKTLGKVTQKIKRELDLSQPYVGDADDVALNLGEVEEIASHFAAHEVKNLLYDNSRRLKWAEASRAIFPFAEAWVEINRTWMRLFAENPHKARRLQQGIGAARSEGFISVDEDSGEQYYNFPGAGMLEDVFGIEDGPIHNMFTGSIDALNPLQGAYFPGIGPLVQLPLGAVLPKTSDWDWAREMLIPFGVPESQSPGDILEEVVPIGIKKVWEAATFDADNNPRQAGMVADIFNQMVLSGQYDITSPEEQEQVLAKARSTAKKYDMVRAVSAALIPGTPRFRQQVEDKKGQWVFTEAIASEYNKHKANDGEEAAEDWLVENFSLTIGELMEGSTLAIRKRPVTESAWAFQRDHPEVYETLPLTGYYIMPDLPNDDFEYDAWVNQFDEKDRVILTPEQKIKSKAQQEAYEFRDEALSILVESGITPQSEQGRDLMRMVDDYLKSEYPGYGETNIGVPARPGEDDILTELRGWQTLEGDIQNSRTWQSVVDFMEVYDGAHEIVQEATGYVTLDSTADPTVVATRQAMYEYGEQLAQQDPGFELLWNDYLVNYVLTRQDQLGFEDDEPFEQLNRRLQGQQGIFPDSTTEPVPSILVP